MNTFDSGTDQIHARDPGKNHSCRPVRPQITLLSGRTERRLIQRTGPDPGRVPNAIRLHQARRQQQLRDQHRPDDGRRRRGEVAVDGLAVAFQFGVVGQSGRRQWPRLPDRVHYTIQGMGKIFNQNQGHL